MLKAVRIAILAWGSLIWSPRSLSFVGEWQRGGPILRIEFSRIALDRRLTLVIDENDGVDICTRYALSGYSTLDDAITNLQEREATPNRCDIGFFDARADEMNHWAQSEHPNGCSRIREWIRSRTFDAVIWTALPRTFEKRTGEAYTVEAAMRFFESLPPVEKAVADEYIRNAPEEVKTPFRTRFLARD
jgi:hypothetical protein